MLNKFLRVYCIGLVYYATIWCCDSGFLDIENNCYFQKDIQFLQALIKNSQFGRKPPSLNLNPITLGHQTWGNGRLIELCASPTSNTECRIEYTLSGLIPNEIGSLTHFRKLSLESNKFIGVIPQ